MKILFACSASGGHILPALGVARELKKINGQNQILILTEKNRISSDILTGCGFEIVFLQGKVPFNIRLPIVNSVMKLLMNSARIARILKEFRPEVIFGFGGYVSIVPVLLSRRLGARCIIHEQNVLMGKANRFLARFAEIVAVSFKETKDYFANSKIARKIIYTGLPLRNDLKLMERNQAADFFKLDPKIFTILVLGGSSGSSKINRYFLNALDKLSLKNELQIVHIAGSKDESFVRDFYGQRPNLKARTFGFLKEMSFAFSLADISISRSGASTLYELSFFKLPSILIPYPYAAGHQFANARVLSDPGAAILLEEENVSEGLGATLSLFLTNKGKLAEMKNSFPQDLIFDAGKIIAGLIR